MPPLISQDEAWEKINLRVARMIDGDGWSEVRRWHNPPRVRIRKHIHIEVKGIGGGVFRRTNQVRNKIQCKDVYLDERGNLTWPNVECDAE